MCYSIKAKASSASTWIIDTMTINTGRTQAFLRWLEACCLHSVSAGFCSTEMLRLVQATCGARWWKEQMDFQFLTFPIHSVQRAFCGSGKTKVTIHCLPFDWHFKRWGEEIQAAFEFQAVEEKNKFSTFMLPKLSKYIGSYIVATITVFILIGVILLASFEMDCPQKWDIFLACWP